MGAFQLLGLPEVPTIRLKGLTQDQIRAIRIADNKLALNAGWNEESLAVELNHLLTLDGLDVTLTGFEMPEIDLIVLQGQMQESDPADEVQNEILTGPPVTRSGDVWQLGKHRLFCGNSLEESSFERLMGQQRADVVS